MRNNHEPLVVFHPRVPGLYDPEFDSVKNRKKRTDQTGGGK